MQAEVIEILIEKNPSLKNLRDKLEAMKVGSYCLHRSWGFGQIQSYEPSDNKLIIDFDTRKGHPMDPVFCVEKLEILETTNILVRQRTEPEIIQQLVKSNPSDLLVEILSHCPDNCASAAELEAILQRLLGEGKFKKWWSAAKKIIAKDPRIAVPTKKTDPYILRDEPVKIETEILETFYATRHPREKIHLAEKLMALSDRVDAVKEDLPKILETLTEAIQKAPQLTEAERLHGVWVRNDFARHLNIDVESLEPSSTSLVQASKDLGALAETLPVQFQKRFLDLISRVFPDTWTEVIIGLLKNSSGKFTQECMTFLFERESREALQKTLQIWLEEQSLKSPLIMWILKNRKSRKYDAVLAPIMGPRLLAAALYAIDYEALQSNSTRRIALAELLSDDSDLVSDLIQNAGAEVARDLAQSLLMSQGFENLTKKSLLARFIKSFPQIQSLVAGDAQREAERFVVSRPSFELRQKELTELINVKIPENKQAIATAREHGDLRENSEYKMARQDQQILMARKSQLESELSRAHVTDFKDTPTDTVGVGCVVELQQDGKPSVTYSILGAWDSEPKNHILSYKTPLVQGLLGHAAGTTVKITVGDNEETWTIKSIGRWVDTQK